MIGTKVPIVFGSYAKKAKDSSADTVLFTWSCGVYLDGLPFANLGPLIEKVDFTLHKSFENPVRQVFVAPFFISAEGWGEFPIIIEIYLRKGGSIKATHYLKLNAAEDIVVSESFDTLVFSTEGPYMGLSDIAPFPEIPIFVEFLKTRAAKEYSDSEEEFLKRNRSTLEKLRASCESLCITALEKESALFTILNARRVNG